MPTKAKLEDENKTLSERVSLLEEEKKAWIARELKAIEHQERIEDDFKQIVAQKDVILQLRGAILVYERIIDRVPKENLSRLISVCKAYECGPEGLKTELEELRRITEELEKKYS